ncbi:hypothetical protein [Streptomyces sp. ATCC 21386]|jgi:hypothetical protein|uniref:hypothetical protein n=1 Tax=Streptomyces sp. ATCC 21386 TaxID=2699428 RepID=UPI001BFF1275|nr:hypothetical protein [Streptomyces sp. ATCC 21386]
MRFPAPPRRRGTPLGRTVLVGGFCLLAVVVSQTFTKGVAGRTRRGWASTAVGR